MKSTLLAMLAFLSIFVPDRAQASPPQRLGLKEALDKNIIAVVATANGQSYRAKGLHLKITNQSGLSLMLTVDQGLIFRAADSAKQDLLAAGAEVLILQPYKQGELDAQTFCARSRALAPAAGDAYGQPYMGSESLIRLAQYLKKTYTFNALGQSAVWVLTDGHELASAYDPSMPSQSDKLMDFMTGLLNVARPEVYKVYATGTAPNQPVFEGKILRVYAAFEHRLAEPARLTLGIFDSQGKQVQGVFENRPFAGGKEHRFKVDFQAAGAAPGTYYIRLKQGETVLHEKSVTVG